MLEFTPEFIPESCSPDLQQGNVSSLALEFTLGVCLPVFLPGVGGFCVDKKPDNYIRNATRGIYHPKGCQFQTAPRLKKNLLIRIILKIIFYRITRHKPVRHDMRTSGNKMNISIENINF